MTRDETEFFVRVTMIANAGRDEIGTADELLANVEATNPVPALLGIMLHRMRLAEPELRFSLMALLFLADLSHGIPGRAVMWAHYVVQRTYEIGKTVDTSILADDFPWGFPTNEAAGKIWDQQKDDRGNRLDRAEAWRRAA